MNSEKFIADADVYKAKILKAVQPQLENILAERDRLKERLKKLEAQVETLKSQKAELEQGIEDFKTAKIEAGLQGADLKGAGVLATKRGKIELSEGLLERLETEIAETIDRGKAIQTELFAAWRKALAEYHAEIEAKFQKLHEELSTFHASYIAGAKKVHAEIMAQGQYSRFPKRSEPGIKGYYPLLPSWGGTDYTIYSVIKHLAGLVL